MSAAPTLDACGHGKTYNCIVYRIAGKADDKIHYVACCADARGMSGEGDDIAGALKDLKEALESSKGICLNGAIDGLRAAVMGFGEITVFRDTTPLFFVP